MTLKQQILGLLDEQPGLTDREITDRLKGKGTPQQPVNQACRQMFKRGQILRREGDDGLIRNFPEPREESEHVGLPECQKLRLLREVGFVKAGQWFPDRNSIVFDLSAFGDQRNVLYAFVVEGAVMYVGKTEKGLKQRLKQYEAPGPTQRTNLNNCAMIKEALKAGKGVEIYVFPDHGLWHYGEFHLNLAAGLEGSIIARLSPPWNR